MQKWLIFGHTLTHQNLSGNIASTSTQLYVITMGYWQRRDGHL